jgi:hypothetical protein
MPQLRVSIRYPFDFAFPPNPTAPADFVADGNNQPPGGAGYTVVGALYDSKDVTFTTPLSNPSTVNVTQGVWSMGPFTDAATGGSMAPGDYLFRVCFLFKTVQLDDHAVLVQLT